MAGELHEMSRVMGRIEARLENIDKDVQENRSLADKRHTENSCALRALNARLADMELALKDVPTLKTDVASMKAFYVRFGSISAMAVGLASALAWFIYQAVVWALAQVNWAALLKAFTLK